MCARACEQSGPSRSGGSAGFRCASHRLQGYTEVERSIAKRDGKKLIDPIPPPGLMDGCDPGFDFFDERVLQGNWRKQARR